MVIKRKMLEGVYGIVSQRLSDRAKAILPKFQSPGVDRTLVGNTPVTRRLRQPRNRVSSVPRSGRRPMHSECIQGDKRRAYVALLRFSMTKHGMAYGPRGLWSRSRHSSRGRHDPPGSAGKPRAGRGAAGNQMFGNR